MIQEPTTQPLSLPLPSGHQKLIIAQLVDKTDRHDNLVFEREYELTAVEEKIESTAAVHAIENVLTAEGMIFFKQAPLPESRQIKSEVADLVIDRKTITFNAGGYRSAVLNYSGGERGRIAKLHEYQLALRGYVPGRDCQLLSNTWGDRNANKKLSEEFLMKEIDAAARLGIDVVEIDEGWQAGKSADIGGRNEDFWSVPDFWKVNQQKFPRGLEPIVAKAKEKGMRIGLWFVADAISDYANWSSDADVLLHYWKSLGIEFFKVDGVKIRSREGEISFAKFVQRVLGESQKKITIDLDVTNQVRPGYFGMMDQGPIFVENRYTESRRYWPHMTLRNLWMLSRWVAPQRLRMEFLNNERNEKFYGDDPLAPARYDAAYLFATVMFSSPLAWFENSGLSEKFISSAKPLIAMWKKYRDEIYRGPILPIGERPSGKSWTGFLASDYAVVFRELNEREEFAFDVPGKWEVLAGEGSVAENMKVRLSKKLSYLFLKRTGR